MFTTYTNKRNNGLYQESKTFTEAQEAITHAKQSFVQTGLGACVVEDGKNMYNIYQIANYPTFGKREYISSRFSHLG